MNKPNGNRVNCSLSRTIDYTANTVTLVVPRGCLGKPRWVRVGMGALFDDWNGDQTLYADDARTNAVLGSERLGHATAAFTMQTYTHVIPGMDEAAASAVADLILGNGAGHISGHTDAHEVDEASKEPADLLRFRRSAGSSSSSGGARRSATVLLAVPAARRSVDSAPASAAP